MWSGLQLDGQWNLRPSDLTQQVDTTRAVSAEGVVTGRPPHRYEDADILRTS